MTKQPEPSEESMKKAAEVYAELHGYDGRCNGYCADNYKVIAHALDERFEAGRRDSTYHLNDCICGDCK